jgi:hypothetical protein
VGGKQHPLPIEGAIPGSEPSPSAKDLIVNFDAVLVATGPTRNPTRNIYIYMYIRTHTHIDRERQTDRQTHTQTY